MSSITIRKPDQDVASLLGSCARCCTVMMQIRGNKPDDWLNRACAQLASYAPVGPAACHAFLCDPLIHTRKWRVLEVGAAGLPTIRADRQLRSFALRHWPEDDVLPKLSVDEHRQVRALCVTRRDLATDDVWFRSRLHMARRHIDLHEFIRAVEPLENGAAMVVQLDGLDEHWSPGNTDVAWLAGLAHAIAMGYDERFLRPVRMRSNLVADLSPAQIQVIELLASGLPESTIAQRLDRSRCTIHQHAKRIYKLLGVNCRLALRDKWHGCDELPGYMPLER